MCIIVYKPKGIDYPSLDILKQCFESNPDGAGLMYLTSQGRYNHFDYTISNRTTVRYIKGLMDWDSFEREYQKVVRLGKDFPVIMHFRIMTHGELSPECTQPIEISNVDTDSRRLSGYCGACVVHNGIIDIHCENGYSDSQMFSRKVLAPLKLYQDITNSKCDLISMLIGYSNKLIIMNRYGEIAMFGDFIVEDGIYYSNHSYVPIDRYSEPVTTYSGGYDYYDL